jgi:AraC-like DNA-binding protein
MPYPKPVDCSEQQRVFNCPIYYGCERERIYFPAELLDYPLVVGDNDSRRALEIEARRRLDAINVSLVDERPEIAGIKRFIADRLKGGEPPSVEVAAEALGISARTLQRRLEAVRINYRDLIDLVRRELAKEYMADSSLTQVDIAFLLGYSEQSTFHRAFRRWFEMTPGEYRALGSKGL